MKIISLVSIATILLTGCATTPQEDPVQKEAERAWLRSLQEAQDGFGPHPDNYQEIIKEYMSKSLKDPDSARYSEFRSLANDLKIVDMKRRIAVLGYSTCVDINAKNSYGGYTGAKRHWFLIRDGQVVDNLSPETSGLNPSLSSIMAQLIDITCKTPKVKQ